MTDQNNSLRLLPCLDSAAMSAARQQELNIPFNVAAALGKSAVEAAARGCYANGVGQPQSGDLLRRRIHRVLAIARDRGYPVLVLGAWGCGAFGNDPLRTARDFREALETDFRCTFADIVFAITDWSPERRFLGPFRDVFAPC